MAEGNGKNGFVRNLPIIITIVGILITGGIAWGTISNKVSNIETRSIEDRANNARERELMIEEWKKAQEKLSEKIDKISDNLSDIKADVKILKRRGN